MAAKLLKVARVRKFADKLRKNRDDLQEAIALVKKGGFELPLQFTNFRD